MNVYEPANSMLPDNPYTEDSFRQNMRNRTNELKQAVLTSRSQPSADPSAEISGPSASVPTQTNYKPSGNKSFSQDLSAAIARSGFSPDWAGLITEIVRRESSFNPRAKNPNSSAYGYGQFLDATRANYEKKTGLSYDNPVNQLIMMMHYVKDRYGTPEKAISFWDKNHWY